MVKLGAGLTADRLGTVWQDPQGDFRVDAGLAVLPEGKLKTWHLQINKQPASPAAKRLYRDFGSDARLLWDEWNLEHPQDYASWVKVIVDQFS
jgi:hypothetical protein